LPERSSGKLARPNDHVAAPNGPAHGRRPGAQPEPGTPAATTAERLPRRCCRQLARIGKLETADAEILPIPVQLSLASGPIGLLPPCKSAWQASKSA